MRKLPIGEQDFASLRRRDYVYVDKTVYIHRLMTGSGRFFFLSRPRRFGKSLLLSTIRSVFEGKKELFEGLYIYDKLPWERYPVVLLDMGALASVSLDRLTDSLTFNLKNIAAVNGVTLTTTYPVDMLKELIFALYQASGKQVILLVDEYDKPILDSINNPGLAGELRDFLGRFYTIIKSSAEALGLTLLTGVSKVSQTSIFSGLNNLNDISLNDEYAGVCGYTQAELEDSFDEHILSLAGRYKLHRPEIYVEIKKWYNGYSWDGETLVYNPFSVLKLLEERRFGAYWYATGTPSFLVKLIRSQNDLSPVLEDNIIVREGFDGKQSLESMQVVPLCFQTGYLTIKKRDLLKGEYTLQVPNEEVRVALMDSLLTNLVSYKGDDLELVIKKLGAALQSANLEAVREYLATIYANQEYHAGTDTEGQYHNVFKLIMKWAGIEVQSEVRTDTGRVDCVLKFPERTYVVEIKAASGKKALAAALKRGMKQIKDKKYYQPYLHQGKPVHLLAFAFSKGMVAYKQEVL